MRLLLLGVSHHSAPVEVRERLAVGGDALPGVLGSLVQQPVADEAVLVSTCNRAEVYAACHDVEVSTECLVRLIAEAHAVPVELLQRHVYTRVDEEAVRHLFRVASGLDSMIVGEPQIFGQVKEAFSVAVDHRFTGPLLNRLFQWSFTVGKRVRAETGIADGAVSVSYAATSLARKIFGDLDGLALLVVGAGDMARLTAQHLQAQGVRRIVIASRTPAHAHGLAARIGAGTAPWSAVDAALAEADMVVTATGSPTPILTRAMVQKTLQTRRRRRGPLFVIDIAVPRDVDPAVGQLDPVFLYDIDDLENVVRENLAQRHSQIERAEDIVAEEVVRFAGWLRSRRAAQTVVALRDEFDRIRRTELARLQTKLGPLTEDQLGRVYDVTRLLIEKLLLAPTTELKAIDDPQTATVYAQVIAELFRLAPAEPVREAETADTDGFPSEWPS